MGHVIRAKVLQDRIEKVIEKMKWEGEGRQCGIYLEFKMKQLPKKLREPSYDLSKNRGMSWNGTSVFYDQTEDGKRR